MNEQVKDALWHIRQAIDDVQVHIADTQTFADFQRNLTTRRAVERELEIMGEAMNRILKIDSAIPITDTQRIIYTRNRIIHGYDSVDVAIVWKIVQQHLALLRQEVDALLSENQADEEL